MRVGVPARHDGPGRGRAMVWGLPGGGCFVVLQLSISDLYLHVAWDKWGGKAVDLFLLILKIVCETK